MNRYIPTPEDRAVCASVGEWYCTPEQRGTIRRHADTIEAALPDDDELQAARRWVWTQDDAGNSAPFVAVKKRQYTFGATSHAGALAWLVEIVEYRRAEKARCAEMLRLYRAAYITEEGRCLS